MLQFSFEKKYVNNLNNIFILSVSLHSRTCVHTSASFRNSPCDIFSQLVPNLFSIALAVLFEMGSFPFSFFLYKDSEIPSSSVAAQNFCQNFSKLLTKTFRKYFPILQTRNGGQNPPLF